MSTIDYSRMRRLATRCGDLVTQTDIKPIVKTVYDERARSWMDEFLAADAALTAAESAAAKENAEAHNALLELDQPYGEARAVVLAYHPTATLPQTLKAQPTDTDRKVAIEALLDVVDDHIGQRWADTILAGPLGTRAASVVQELNEAIAANSAYAKARDRRAAAYGPAYERYMMFKNVVRNAYGPHSQQYRFIHLRSDAKGDPSTGGGDAG